MMRGLSPIVAVVMLILIAIAASVLVYVWMSGLVASTPTTEPTLQERIKIDAVKVMPGTDNSWNTGNENVTVYFKNVGEVTITSITAYVIDALTDSVVCPTANTFTDASNDNQISPGETAYTEIKPSQNANDCYIDTGRPYIVKVVTERGTEATYTFVVEQ